LIQLRTEVSQNASLSRLACFGPTFFVITFSFILTRLVPFSFKSLAGHLSSCSVLLQLQLMVPITSLLSVHYQRGMETIIRRRKHKSRRQIAVPVLAHYIPLHHNDRPSPLTAVQRGNGVCVEVRKNRRQALHWCLFVQRRKFKEAQQSLPFFTCVKVDWHFGRVCTW